MRSSVVPLVVTIVMGFTSALQTQGPPASSPHLFVAIIDERGVAGPLLRFDGRDWHHDWPSPGEALAATPLPDTLAAIPDTWLGAPLPAIWHAWDLDVGWRSVTLIRPVRVAYHCLPGIGLLSDYSVAATSADHAFPKRKVAIAVSDRAVTLQRAEVLDGSTLTASPLARQLDGSFLAFARETAGYPLSNLAVRWTHGWIAHAPSGGPSVTLVEGQTEADRTGRLFAGHFWTGLLGDRQAHVGRVDVTDEDFKVGLRHRPLGILTVGGRSFWLNELHGYGTEAYQVMELFAPHVRERLRVPGGGC